MNQVPNTMSPEQALNIVEEVRRRAIVSGEIHDAAKVAISVLAQTVAAYNKLLEEKIKREPQHAGEPEKKEPQHAGESEKKSRVRKGVIK